MKNVACQEQFARVRKQYEADSSATTILDHFQCQLEFIDSCYAEGDSGSDEQVRAAVRFVIETCYGNNGLSSLGATLIWVLKCNYHYVWPGRYADEVIAQRHHT